MDRLCGRRDDSGGVIRFGRDEFTDAFDHALYQSCVPERLEISSKVASCLALLKRCLDQVSDGTVVAADELLHVCRQAVVHVERDMVVTARSGDMPDDVLQAIGRRVNRRQERGEPGDVLGLVTFDDCSDDTADVGKVVVERLAGYAGSVGYGRHGHPAEPSFDDQLECRLDNSVGGICRGLGAGAVWGVV